jgi:Secretion system C-terminal sorting domain
MKKILFLLFLLISVNVFSQQQSSHFSLVYGEPHGNSLYYADELENGDFIVIGWGAYYFTNSPQSEQIYAARINHIGEVLWEKFYGDPNVIHSMGKTFKTSTGNYVTVGSAGFGSTDVYLLSIDSDGNQIFENYYDSQNGFDAYGMMACETQDSNYMILSTISNTPAFIKVDRNGNEIFRKRYDTLVSHIPLQIIATPDNGYITMGKNTGLSTYIAKFDANAELIWIRYPYINNEAFFSFPLSLLLKSDSTYLYYCGKQIISGGDYFNELINYSSDGDSLGLKPLWGLNGLHSYGTGTLFKDLYSENYLFCNTSISTPNFALWRLDSLYNPSLFYQINIPSPNYYGMYYAIRTKDRGYLMVGDYVDPGNNYWAKFFVLKLSEDMDYKSEDYKSTFKIFPNPSTDGNITINFDTQKSGNYSLKMFTVNGQLVYQNDFYSDTDTYNKTTINIDAHNYQDGLYIIEFSDEEFISRKKLVIQKQ